jgi:hypothetical protein
MTPTRETATMQKLIDKFRAAPNARNALRLLDYADRHPFALCNHNDENSALIKKLQQVRMCAMMHPKAR